MGNTCCHCLQAFTVTRIILLDSWVFTRCVGWGWLTTFRNFWSVPSYSQIWRCNRLAVPKRRQPTSSTYRVTTQEPSIFCRHCWEAGTLSYITLRFNSNSYRMVTKPTVLKQFDAGVCWRGETKKLLMGASKAAVGTWFYSCDCRKERGWRTSLLPV